MNESIPQIRCQFTLSEPGVGNTLHVGSVLDLSLDIAETYPGDGVSGLRCRGHVVSVEEAGQPGKVSVVCEIDQLECPPELWGNLATAENLQL